MEDSHFVSEFDCFNDIADNECAFEFIERPSFPDILKEFLSIDIFSDNVLMGFGMDSLLVFDELGVVQDLHDF